MQSTLRWRFFRWLTGLDMSQDTRPEISLSNDEYHRQTDEMRATIRQIEPLSKQLRDNSNSLIKITASLRQ